MKTIIILMLICLNLNLMFGKDNRTTKLNPNQKVTLTLPNGDKIRSVDRAENWFKLQKQENNLVTLSTDATILKSSDRGKTWWYFKNVSSEENHIINVRKLNLYPNPAKDMVIFQLDSDVKVEGLISIYDTFGHKISANVIKIFEGNNLIEINIQDFDQGTYNLSVLVNGYVRTASFVIVK